MLFHRAWAGARTWRYWEQEYNLEGGRSFLVVNASPDPSVTIGLTIPAVLTIGLWTGYEVHLGLDRIAC
jgi:hypothetical protein